MNKYLTEFIGTFFLSITAILATTGNYSAWAPLAIGGMLIALTSISWDISGAHFNPVVSIVLLIRGKTDRGDILYYILVQVLGAVMAGAIAVFLIESSLRAVPEIVPRQNAGLPALIAEFLGAFAWSMAIISATFRNENAIRVSLMVGFVVMALGVAFRDVSGAMFNPALAVAYMVAGMAFWSDLLIYLIGPLFGGAAAATVFFLMNKEAQDNFKI